MPLFFDTAGSIINDAAIELGLVSAAMADPFASTDANIVRLRTLLKSIGRTLRREKQWTWLRQSYLFNTVANQGLYPVPADFDAIVNQTEWNRTTRLPLGGPLSPQDVAFLKARLVGVVFTVLFDMFQGQFRAYPDTNTPGGYLIAYEYMSRWWAQAQAQAWKTTTAYSKFAVLPATATVVNSLRIYFTLGGGTSGAGPGPNQVDNSTYSDGGVTDWRYAAPWAANTAFGGGGAQFTYVQSNGALWAATAPGVSGLNAPSGVGTWADGTVTWTYVGPLTLPQQEAPSASTDVLWFDANLLVKALELEFKKKAGFATQDDSDDYEAALHQAMEADSAAPILRVDHRTYVDPLLGEQNIPITGLGQ